MSLATEIELLESTPVHKGVQLPIYMDNHATTALDPRVLEAMLPYMTKIYGNAASRNHQFGWEAEQGVELAREQIAKLIGATPKEIIFTSGATEGNNLAIKGVAEMYREKGNHIITQVTEHKAVLDTCKRLEKNGYKVTYLPVQPDGLVSVADIEAAMTTETILVTIMYANNEIGVVNPIAEIGKLCHAKGVLFHTDGVQAVGKIPVNVQTDNIDLLSLTAHKIYGPKGVGALYVRRRNPRVQLNAQIDGGGHERGMRSGTLNVAGIVGLGKACEIAGAEMEAEIARLTGLRDYMRGKFEAALDYIAVNGNMDHHLPGNLNMSFVYVEGESLLMGINDIAVSSGSACTSATLEPSYVLKALGLGDDVAHSSIRFGLGRFNTKEEVDYVADKLIDTVLKLRELSPLYEMVKEGIDLTKIEWTAH
ncbi:cysteine desulfurase family protein [Terriglobus roseus DSM 18391]|uniref:Cysteine desulfurase IscS n=1 Tax=Terriglobus roseus (strain DSM 18391 / NRRL B-41598 / KBS 63) TaxID=926566 RepID=I3ZM94_TERRK|nr:IscS subfamily cysteine desulfurase [Terriglobus roseus]AFL90362.1 cysteine desulfurase family protein [Terriglobus roseus DSM 18391]